MVNQRAIEDLNKFCSLYKDTNDPKLLAKILDARRAMLSGIAEVYADNDQEDLFLATAEEVEIIESLLIVKE